MYTYVLRRLLATVPVMGVVALFVFSLLYVTPGDPAAVIAGDYATAQDVARIRAQLGLDQSFLIRFGGWTWALLHGDLGVSIFSRLPVTTLLAQRLEPTVALTVCTMLFSVAVAVPLGVWAAWRAGSAGDRAVMAFSVVGFSVPVFVLAYLLIFTFSVRLGLLPVQGYVSVREGLIPFARHMILPSLALGSTFMALIARITRASMLEVLSQDYIRTAQAKGLDTRRVLLGHALKNGAVPIVTVIGIGVALLVGGAVVTETVFAIPGIGRLTVDAILRRDYPIIQGVILMFSAVYVLLNLAVDLLYPLLDPRIRYVGAGR
jgi:peptide/nickel transport system permease protein